MKTINRSKHLTALVSVVIPTKNGAKFIDQAIRSVLSQTYDHWELIIVDDASTDETPSIIARWAARNGRIRVETNQENRKLPATLNVGFNKASGDYFIWLSDDDYFLPTALQTMVEMLDSEHDIGMVYPDYALINAEGCRVGTRRVEEPEYLAVGNGTGPHPLFRRVVFAKLGGFDEQLFLVEDYDFSLRTFCHFKIRPIHTELYAFRLHANGLTATHSDRVPIMKHLAQEKNLPLLKKRSRHLAARCHLSLIDSCLVQGHHLRAARHAVGALICDPFSSVRHNGKLIVQGFLGPTATRAIAKVKRKLVPTKGA